VNLLTQGVRQVIGLDPSSRLLEMVRRTGLSRQAKAIEADLGPVRYLSSLVGPTDETTMRLFILAVALLLDPAAVLLLLVATKC
jgi:hypothetical protein